jgi:hypothetical protein
MARSPDSSNLLLGNFSVYVAELTAGGLPKGERHVGNCSNVTLNTTPDKLTKRENMTSARGVYKEVTRSTETIIKLTMDEITVENLALALYGTIASLAQSGAAVTAYEIEAVQQGLYYSVGKRSISLVTVEPSGGGTPYVLNDDYTIDAAQGRIYIVPSGGIADGTDIQVDFTHAAVTSSTIRLGKDPNIRRYVRFVADPTCGSSNDWEFWNVQMIPSGDLGLITDEFMSIEITGTSQLDSTNHPDEPYGRMIERVAVA